MPERMTAQNRWLARVERARNGVDSLDDAASSFSSVLGEVQNIQQEYSELSEQGTKFKDNIKDLEPKEREQNEPVQLARQDEREVSKSPSSQADVFRGEGEPD
jgi:septation ring formation regulator EzrA